MSEIAARKSGFQFDQEGFVVVVLCHERSAELRVAGGNKLNCTCCEIGQPY